MRNKTDYRIIAEIDAADFDNVAIATKGSPGSNSFGFGWTGPEDFARRVCHGPILSGPYLYGYGKCTVIHNGPIEARVPVLHLETGDVIRIRNLVGRGHLREFDFRATVDSRGYISFEVIAGFESKMANGRKLDVKTFEITKEQYSHWLDIKDEVLKRTAFKLLVDTDIAKEIA